MGSVAGYMKGKHPFMRHIRLNNVAHALALVRQYEAMPRWRRRLRRLAYWLRRCLEAPANNWERWNTLEKFWPSEEEEARLRERIDAEFEL